MAPPAPSEPPPDEESPFASWDEFGRPLTDESIPPASGFSQGTHEHNISAHNTTLGGAAEAHRQPLAASGTREPSALGLGAPPSSFSTPSYVTRASFELDAAAPSLSTSMPTHLCRHTPTSDSHVSDGALRFDNYLSEASASRLPPPLHPSWGSGAAPTPTTDLFHRMAPPQPPPDRCEPTNAVSSSCAHNNPSAASAAPPPPQQSPSPAMAPPPAPPPMRQSASPAPPPATSLRRFTPLRPIVKWASPRLLSDPSGQPLVPPTPPQPPRPSSAASGVAGTFGAPSPGEHPFAMSPGDACAALASLAVTSGFPVAALPALLSSVAPSPQALLVEFSRSLNQQPPFNEDVLRFILDLSSAAVASSSLGGAPLIGVPAAPVGPSAVPAPPRDAPRAPPEPSGFLGLFPPQLKEAAHNFLGVAQAFGHPLPATCNDLLYAWGDPSLSMERSSLLAYSASELINSDISPSIALEIALDRFKRPRSTLPSEGSAEGIRSYYGDLCRR